MNQEKPFNQMIKLEKIKGHKGSERRLAYDEFNKNRLEQKKNIATLTALMLENIADNPSLSRKELSEMIENYNEEIKRLTYHSTYN